MKVAIWPDFNPKENGEGGIRRVWEALYKHLPAYDVEIVRRIEDADVVNVHADWIKTDKPIAYSNHGLYWAGFEWPKWALEANAKLIKAAKLSHALSVPSRFVHNVFARGMLLNPFVLYHGVDIEDWEPQETHGYVFWGKTRVDSICNPDPVDRLAELCPEVSFISTFGNSELSNLTLTGRLTYERSKALIRHAGVYLATVQETGGITVLEAMASGVPPIGFRHGVNSEIIEHGVTGWLVDEGDYAGLREGLYYCLANRQRIGENARQSVIERFQWKYRVQDYLAFYQSAIEGANHEGPSVSIIVTAYNLADYLPACLNSILRQDFSDWECIIVNDASPDNCGEIAESYARKDRRFRVIHNSANLYLSEARNAGIRSAKGRYVLPLDADDELGEGTLRTLSQALEQDYNLDIVTGGFQLIEPDGRRWLSSWPGDTPSFNRQIRHQNQVPYASMYRKWVWERTGGYRRRWKSAEDAEFWTRAMSYGAVPAKVTKNPTLVYNNRPSSMSHTIREPDWTAWFIWSRYPQFTPFGASGEYPNQPARPVLSYDPPQLSVIIPCGPNHESYLQDALDSIVAQTFQNFEVIVVNDTGKKWYDGNGFRNPYLNGYPFVRFLDAESNGKPQGPAAARNRGIAASTTACFVLLDADDYAQPLFLELLYRSWKEYGGWLYTDWYDQEGALKEAQDFLFEDALIKMPGPSTGIYSKADWKLVGGFDESIEFWEDWDYQITLMGHGICGRRIRYPGFTYRYDTGTRRELSYQNEKEALKIIRNKHKIIYQGGCYNS